MAKMLYEVTVYRWLPLSLHYMDSSGHYELTGGGAVVM